MQLEGIGFHNKFSPVVNWSTFTLIILMSEMAGWESIQIDYVLDSYQSPNGSDICIHLPEYFYVDGTITMSQPEIIKEILNSLGIYDELKMHDTPENVILTKMKTEMGGINNVNIVQ